MMRRTGTLAIVVLLFAVSPLAAQLSFPPTTPRFQDVVRLAQDGYGDSARTVIARILSRMTKTDTAFPEALYTAGYVARTGDSTSALLKRVAVEYSSSPWADKAQVRLAQLAYGNADMPDVMARVTRLFADYPASPVIPTAALWGARAAFEQQKMQQACDWLTRGLAVVGDDLELRNQLQFTRQRCAVGTGVQMAPVVPETLRTGPPPRPAPDTTRRSPAPAPPPSAPARVPASPWRIQVAAIKDKVVIRRVTQKIEAAGFTAYQVPGPGGVTRIQAGPFNTRAAAAAQLAKLKRAAGGSPFVTPAP
jgi:cell division septation protein DedD